MLFLQCILFSIVNIIYQCAIFLLFLSVLSEFFSFISLFTRANFGVLLNLSVVSLRNQIVVPPPEKIWRFSSRIQRKVPTRIHFNSPERLQIHGTISGSASCPSIGEYQAQLLHFQTDIAIFPECNLVSVCTSFQMSVLPHWLVFIFICLWTFSLLTTAL